MKVRAHAALSAKGTLEPFEYDLGPRSPQQVDVRVTHCGICHTDSAMVSFRSSRRAGPGAAPALLVASQWATRRLSPVHHDPREPVASAAASCCGQ
jgi:hypothetical protein